MDAAGERPMQLGVYALDELIGEGATSRVFRASHLTLGTAHAVKVLRSDSRLSKERFLEEGRALCMLRHPNVIAVHAILEEADTVALVMELIDGDDLETWRWTEAPPFLTRMRVFREIVAGVRELHRHGYVHRDLKPANVLMARLCGVYVPKLADLGIARRPGPRTGPQTLAGVAMGTPRYMPPEQIRDAATADPRSDIFALGVMLYELVADRLPFTSLDLEKLHEDILTRGYVPLREAAPEVSPQLSALVDRMLSPLPDDRPSSCDEVLAALPDTLGGEPTLRDLPGPPVPTLGAPSRPRRRRRAVQVGLLAMAAVVLGAAWTSRAERRAPDPVVSWAVLDPPTCDVLPDPALPEDRPPRGTLVLAEDASAGAEEEPSATHKREGRLRLFKKKDDRPPRD